MEDKEVWEARIGMNTTKVAVFGIAGFTVIMGAIENGLNKPGYAVLGLALGVCCFFIAGLEARKR
jgi:hypothetical protein